MSRFFASLAIAAAIFTAAGISMTQGAGPATAPAAKAKPDALNFTVKDIDGKDVDLTKYVGKVCLIVNVASKCGNTPQYTPLEANFEKYKDKGFVILGFPANEFGGQEPGTNADIKEFCSETYKVAFPMFSKVVVKGDGIVPLFKYLTTQESKPLSKGDIAWNFEKFLISKEGKLVGRFANKTKPDDPTVIAAIEAELAK